MTQKKNIPNAPKKDMYKESDRREHIDNVKSPEEKEVFVNNKFPDEAKKQWAIQRGYIKGY